MSSGEGFPKEEHLLKTRDFRNVYSGGKAFRRGPLVFYILPNESGGSRIGFSIGSRNIKLASRRNRIKRLLREAYRKNKRGLKNGFDAVIVVKRDFPKTVSYGDIKKIFLGLAKEAGVLK